MDVDGLIITSINVPIRKFFLVDVALEVLLEGEGFDTVVEFEDVDVVQVVEVLPIEPSEGNHTTAYEPSAVSASRFWMVLCVSTYLHSLESVCINVDDQKIIEIVAKPACENVNLVVVNHAGVSPAGQERRALQFTLHPPQFLS